MIHQLLKFDGFDWDAGNVSKCEEHGLTRDLIEGLFDRLVFVAPDPFARESVNALSDSRRAIGQPL